MITLWFILQNVLILVKRGKIMKRTYYLKLFLLFAILLQPFSLFSQENGIVYDSVQEMIVKKAYEYLGTPYVYAGISKDGVDCSGLVYAVFKEVTGKELPRSVSVLYEAGTKITGTLLPGDLLFFNTVGGVSHVGIYIGAKKIIHAASDGPETGVIISSLEENYYKTRYLGARRVIEYSVPLLKINMHGSKQEVLLKAPLISGVPLYFHVQNTLSQYKFITFIALKSRERIIEKRIAKVV